MGRSFRLTLAVLIILIAVVTGCGGSTGSSPAGDTVDAQLRDDNNWQVIQTADT